MHCAGGLLVDASLQVSETLTSSAALPGASASTRQGLNIPAKLTGASALSTAFQRNVRKPQLPRDLVLTKAWRPTLRLRPISAPPSEAVPLLSDLCPGLPVIST